MLHSDSFHDGTGLDIHVRTTIDSYYSYMEAAAIRMGNDVLEVNASEMLFLLNGERIHRLVDDDKSFLFDSGGRTYQFSLQEKHDKKRIYRLDLGATSILFKFFAHYLTVSVIGGYEELADSVGLLGSRHDGSMFGRDGKPFELTFEDYGFEWQVNPAVDTILFQQDRSPQLPYEKCRMPTQARPSRRRLRASNTELYKQALEACSNVANGQENIDLCVQDVLATGEIGIALVW